MTIPTNVYLQNGETTTPVTQAPVLGMYSKGTVTTSYQVSNSRYGTGQAIVNDQSMHPHLIDRYDVTNPQTVVLCFHGGGGNIRQFAASLGILIKASPSSVSAVNWDAMVFTNSSYWFVQGQFCGAAGQPTPNAFNPNNVYTPQTTAWDNHSFYSGYDDMQMARDVIADARAKNPGATIVVYGHSSGAMFCQRMWHEWWVGGPDVFFITSGPEPTYYATNPTTPSAAKPMCVLYGANDTTLNIYPNHWTDAQWVQSVSHYSPADITHPLTWIGEPASGFQERINAYNSINGHAAETFDISAGVTTAVNVGNRTIWKYGNNGGGAMQMWLLSGADHSNSAMEQCNGHSLVYEIGIFTSAHKNG